MRGDSYSQVADHARSRGAASAVNFTQRQITLFMLAIQFIGSLAVLLELLAGADSSPVYAVLTGIAALLFGTMLVAYWYGWDAARFVVIIVFALLAGFTLDSSSGTASLVLALPPVIALVLGGPAWVAGSGLLQLAVVLVRAGGQGVYAEPVNLTVYGMVISGIVLSRLITDSTQRQIEAARSHAEHQSQDLAAKNAALHVQTRLMDAVEQPVIATDIAGTIIYWNRHAELLYGWPAADAIGRAMADRVQIEYPSETNAERLRHAQAHDSWNGEVLVRNREGTLIPALVSQSPLRDPGGMLIGSVGVAIDITERKRAELALQQAYDRLETRVLERTAELAAANEELREEIAERQRIEASLRESEARYRLASQEAEQANAAKNEFLSRMSHELRTPLNAILGFAQLLEMDELAHDQRESVEQILKGGKHLLGLIDEVLDIARLESGRMSVSLEPVPVDAVVNECIGLVRPLANRRGLTLELRLADVSDMHILADRQRLKQVLVNLLANAVKYNRAGGRVTLATTVTPDGQIRIAVEDNGSGIPADKQKRLFIPFERLGAEQTDVEGTGLGLALSQRLVTLMGGTIGVESVAGEGSTFWVELPRVDSPIAGLTDAAGVAGNAARAAHDQEGDVTHAILYIEDNLSNMRLVQRILAHRPHVALMTAIQGRLGLELARAHRPDMIYLDLHLPDLSGQEVLAQLRGDPATRDIPVVIISADATHRQVDRLLEAGARAYLTKPLDIRQFLASLDETLAPNGAE